MCDHTLVWMRSHTQCAQQDALKLKCLLQLGLGGVHALGLLHVASLELDDLQDGD